MDKVSDIRSIIRSAMSGMVEKAKAIKRTNRFKDKVWGIRGAELRKMLEDKKAPNLSDEVLKSIRKITESRGLKIKGIQQGPELQKAKINYMKGVNSALETLGDVVQSSDKGGVDFTKGFAAQHYGSFPQKSFILPGELKGWMGLAIASGAFGVGSNIASNISANKRLNKMLESNPELKGEYGRYPESEARKLFRTLYMANPDIAKDPNMAATAVKQFIDAQGIPTETFIGLRKASPVDKSKDRIFNAINTVLR